MQGGALTQTHTQTQGRREEGLGNGIARQKIHGDTRACVLGGGQGVVHSTHLSPQASPELQFGISLASVWEQALNFKRCHPPSPNQAGAFNWPDLCGYQGLLARLPRRTGRPRRAARESRRVEGGSYTIPSGLGRAGELKGPWQLPRS